MKISCPRCGASFNVKPEALGPTGRTVKCGKCAHQWRASPEGEDAPTPDIPAAVTPSDFAADFAAETASRSEPEPPLPEPTADPETLDPPPLGQPEETNIDFDSFPKLDIPLPGAEIANDAPVAPDAPEIATEAAEQEPERPKRERKQKAESGKQRGRAILAPMASAAIIAVILASGAVLLQRQITGLIPAATSLYARIGLHSDLPGQGLTIVEPRPEKQGDGNDELLVIVGLIRNDTKKPMDIPVMQARLLDGDGAPLNVWLFEASKRKVPAGGTVEYRTEFRNPPPKAERLDITFTRRKNPPELARNPAPDMKQSSDAKAPSVHKK